MENALRPSGRKQKAIGRPADSRNAQFKLFFLREKFRLLQEKRLPSPALFQHRTACRALPAPVFDFQPAAHPPGRFPRARNRRAIAVGFRRNAIVASRSGQYSADASATRPTDTPANRRRSPPGPLASADGRPSSIDFGRIHRERPPNDLFLGVFHPTRAGRSAIPQAPITANRAIEILRCHARPRDRTTNPRSTTIRCRGKRRRERRGRFCAAAKARAAVKRPFSSTATAMNFALGAKCSIHWAICSARSVGNVVALRRQRSFHAGAAARSSSRFRRWTIRGEGHGYWSRRDWLYMLPVLS